MRYRVKCLGMKKSSKKTVRNNPAKRPIKPQKKGLKLIFRPAQSKPAQSLPKVGSKKGTLRNAKTPLKNPGVFRVNVDFPRWVVQRLDEHCVRLGVTRQSLIKVMIAKSLEDKELEDRTREGA